MTTDCKFNCTCIRIDCPYKHYISSFNDRKDLKELYNRCYDNKTHYEINYKQKIRCSRGLFCDNELCELKHLANYKGRSYIIERWNNFKKEREKENRMMRWKVENDFEEILKKYSFEEKDKKFIEGLRAIVLPPL